jgi:hypothetical protein
LHNELAVLQVPLNDFFPRDMTDKYYGVIKDLERLIGRMDRRFDEITASKKEKDKQFKLGTRKSKFGNHTLNVFKYEAKPYKYLEHWECPKCYWGRRNT